MELAKDGAFWTCSLHLVYLTIKDGADNALENKCQNICRCEAGAASASAFEALTTQSLLGGGPFMSLGVRAGDQKWSTACRVAGTLLSTRAGTPPQTMLLLGGAATLWGLGVASSQEDVSSWAADQEVGRTTPLSTSLPEVQSQAFWKRTPRASAESEEGCSLGPWVTMEGGPALSCHSPVPNTPASRRSESPSVGRSPLKFWGNRTVLA